MYKFIIIDTENDNVIIFDSIEEYGTDGMYIDDSEAEDNGQEEIKNIVQRDFFCNGKYGLYNNSINGLKVIIEEINKTEGGQKHDRHTTI